MIDATWREFRKQMPVSERWAYFDHAAVAPLTAPAQMLLREWSEDVMNNGDIHWPAWAMRLEQVRRLAAEMIHAETAEIALVRNTTEGINLVAEGFPWREGDNIVTLADEFPSNLYPWMQQADRGVETRRVKPTGGRSTLDALAAACDDRTRLVSVSWVGYASGWRCDVAAVAEIAHHRGAYLFLDAIQGLGVFPLDVKASGVDFLAADGHKWLLGPEGAGVFYARQDLLELLRVVGVGWNSVRQSSDYSRIELDLKPHAGRYEGGTYNMGGLVALGRSLELLTALGTKEIAARVLAYTDQLCEQLASVGAVVLSDREGDGRSGIVLFEIPGVDPVAVRKHCMARGVILSCRGGGLRASPHAYNNQQDQQQLLEALSSLRPQ